MNHSLKVFDGGVMEIIVDIKDVPKIDKIVLRYAGLDGYRKTFIPEIQASKAIQAIESSRPEEPEEPEELEDCITGGTYNSVSVVEPTNCTFNIYPKE